MNIDRTEFANALTRAASAAGKDMEITQHIRLESRDGFLVVTGTNLNVTVEVIVAHKGAKLAPVLVPVAIARQAAALSSERVEFTVKAGRATLEGDATFRMPTYPVDNWPTIEAPTAGGWEPSSGFHQRFGAVATHAGTDPGRAHMMAVGLVSGSMVATDAYRMAIIDEEVPTGTLMLVPPVKLGGPVDRIDFDDRHVMFTTPEGRTWARLREAAGYPTPTKLRSMIPSDSRSVSVQVDAEHLAAAAARAAMVAPVATGVRIEQSDKGLRLYVTGDAEFDETLPATFSGDFDRFNVQPAFLKDAIGPNGGMVNLTVEGAIKPVMLSADWWRSVVMPIKVND